MNELQTILHDTIHRLFGDLVDKALIQKAEEGVWPEKLWSALEEAGMTRVLVSEEQGGAGGGWADAMILIKASGEHKAPVPLAETILASAILAEAGIDVPEGPLTVLSGDLVLEGGRISGTAERTPWGRNAGYGVALVNHEGGRVVALVSLKGAIFVEDVNIAREPRDGVTLKGAEAIIGGTVDPGRIHLLGALVRSGQMAGALSYLIRQSVAYANERSQFGKPIGKFQAIQQQLAVLSTQAAVANLAASHAAAKVDEGDAAFEIAVAKVRADDAASEATSIAHQVHGAIGFTYEHELQFATRRLWSWRAEFGSGAEWAGVIGRATLARGADALWPYVTER